MKREFKKEKKKKVYVEIVEVDSPKIDGTHD